MVKDRKRGFESDGTDLHYEKKRRLHSQYDTYRPINTHTNELDYPNLDAKKTGQPLDEDAKKPLYNSAVAKQALRDPSNPEARVALLYQLVTDIEKDCEHAKQEYSHIAGEDVISAALNLGHVFRSKQLAKSSHLEESIRPTKKNSKLANMKSQSGQPGNTLPHLPSILDPSLAEVPFIHPGILPTELSGSPNASYDRLEFMGDAYIELIATRLIYNLFPKLPAGRMSQVRETLVKNETLAEFSLAYKFHERTKLPKSFEEARAKGNKLWKKFLGDIFEAYVAAFILSDPSNGFVTAEKWLTELWSSKLQKIDSPPETRAKDDLARKLMGKGTKLDYREEVPPEVIRDEGKIRYTMGVYFTGWGWERQYLGSGKDLNRNQAGTRAAEQALLNPISDQIREVKKDFDAKVRMEKEQLGERVGESRTSGALTP